MANHNQTFDPYTQSFTIYEADGTTPVQISVADLDAFNLYNTEICVNYGSQLGASLIMLVVIILVTRDSKRRSPLFLLNIVSLMLSTIRSLLQILYWVGPFNETYAYFSGDFGAVPRSAYANSVASVVMTFLFLCTIELSLVLQTRVVCSTFRRRYRLGITMLSSIVALLAIGFRFASMVKNAEAIVSALETYFLTWLASATLIMETISIWYFSTIFVSKLAVTLYQRRKLGLKQWGPMQIICIMGGCTMVIPSIFAILEYYPSNTFPEAGSLALTLVAIFLPLSSIWAAAAIDGASPVAAQFAGESRRKLCSNSASTSQYISNGGLFSSAGRADRKASAGSSQMGQTSHVTTAVAPMGRSKLNTTGSEDSLDDLETLGPVVRIDRSYSVRSGRQHGGVGKD
ncbi:MAG: hypothetical protein M1818_004068 [Claussenomyces sp. TS43310]|nr:MAG: hypothetical protein M1818_004068 [Claussenomyces sp. TS43310]